MSDYRTGRAVALSVFFGGLLLVVCFYAAFDYWLYATWGVEATISRAMRDVPAVVVFVTGLVVGMVVGGLGCHFWWSQPRRDQDPDLRG